jgi:hypothetical protein
VNHFRGTCGEQFDAISGNVGLVEDIAEKGFSMLVQLDVDSAESPRNLAIIVSLEVLRVWAGLEG